ncbi:hypothetical protein J6590_049652 [Homalodisca vitripennis]|nr:hypothetical protein J6590_049652 [Homalodisca vitripennis]
MKPSEKKRGKLETYPSSFKTAKKTPSKASLTTSSSEDHESTKIKQLARRYVHWNSIGKDKERVVRECALARNRPPKAPTGIHPWEKPENNCMLFRSNFVIDHRNAPRMYTFATGYPDVTVSDNAAICISETFQQFSKGGGIFRPLITNVQTLKQRLAAMIENSLTMKPNGREVLYRKNLTEIRTHTLPHQTRQRLHSFKRHINQLHLGGKPMKTAIFSPNVQDDAQEAPKPKLPIVDLTMLSTQQQQPPLQVIEQLQREAGNENQVLRRSIRTPHKLVNPKTLLRYNFRLFDFSTSIFF